MKEVIAVVEKGQIRLPPDLHLPDGLQVRVLWEDRSPRFAPDEREALTEEDVEADLRWATGQRFKG